MFNIWISPRRRRRREIAILLCIFTVSEHRFTTIAIRARRKSVYYCIDTSETCSACCVFVYTERFVENISNQLLASSAPPPMMISLGRLYCTGALGHVCAVPAYPPAATRRGDENRRCLPGSVTYASYRRDLFVSRKPVVYTGRQTAAVVCSGDTFDATGHAQGGEALTNLRISYYALGSVGVSSVGTRDCLSAASRERRWRQDENITFDRRQRSLSRNERHGLTRVGLCYER